MQLFGSEIQVHIAVGVTDMRKSFDTLAGLVQEEVEQDPQSGQLFAFCNRTRDRVKVLWWDGSGFCLLAKRRERGSFAWPKGSATEGVVTMSPGAFADVLGWVEAALPKRSGWYDWNSATSSANTSGSSVRT